MVTDEGCLAIIIRNTGAAPATTLVIDRLKQEQNSDGISPWTRASGVPPPREPLAEESLLLFSTILKK